MGILTRLLGTSPRVAVVEAFAENPDEILSVPEIVRITRVSKRAVYIHVRKLLRDGMLVMRDRVGKCDYYQLNKTDPRGKAVVYLADVMAMGQLESEIRRDEGLGLGQPFPLPRLFRPELLGPSEDEVLPRRPSLPNTHVIYFNEPTASTWTRIDERSNRGLTSEPVSPPTYHPFAANDPGPAESGASCESNIVSESDEPCLRGQVTR
jgi:predicted DNA-binding transcriptional regulator